MLRWRRGTTQRGRSWSSPCSARSTSSQGSAASTGQLTINISWRTAQLFWPRGICHSRETFHIHNCEGQIHQEIFWLVSLLWSVKPKWSSSSSYISMKMWRDVVDVSCRNPYAKLFLLPDRRSSSQSTHLFFPSISFLFLDSMQKLSVSGASGERKLWRTQTTRGGTRASSTRTCVATSCANECLKLRSGTMIGSGPTNF